MQIHGASEERYGLVFFRQQEDQEKALNASKGKLFFGMQIEVTAWIGPGNVRALLALGSFTGCHKEAAEMYFKETGKYTKTRARGVAALGSNRERVAVLSLREGNLPSSQIVGSAGRNNLIFHVSVEQKHSTESSRACFVLPLIKPANDGCSFEAKAA